MKTFYVGLSNTGHDGALALLDSDGNVLYAESCDRYYQSKNAIGLMADDFHNTKKVLEAHVSPGDKVVLCKSWSADAGLEWCRKNDEFAANVKKMPDYADLSFLYDELVASHRKVYMDFCFSSQQQAGFNVRRICLINGYTLEERHIQHHLTHASYAVYASGLNECDVAVIDGAGEGDCARFYHFKDGVFNSIPVEAKAVLTDVLSSIGYYYGILACSICSFTAFGGEEWKIMGLAPYGKRCQPLRDALEKFITVDGLLAQNTEKTAAALLELLGYKSSIEVDEQLTADYAFTLQEFFEDIVVQILKNFRALDGSCQDLVYGGGCALNSTLNGRLARLTGYRSVFVPSCPGDDGNAVGAALAGIAQDTGRLPFTGKQLTAYLGTSFKDKDTTEMLRRAEVLHSKVAADDHECAEIVAGLIASGHVVAWIQGRAEFGPRALGNRSILADPRSNTMKEKVNSACKYRESFRPFAPSTLHEHASEWFEDYQFTPYMERTLKYKPGMGAKVPAVCHNDNSGRLQSVTPELNAKYHMLISEFYKLTGVPMVLNTSCNVMGKPIVHDINDALCILLNTEISVLVIGNAIITKKPL